MQKHTPYGKRLLAPASNIHKRNDCCLISSLSFTYTVFQGFWFNLSSTLDDGLSWLVTWCDYVAFSNAAHSLLNMTCYIFPLIISYYLIFAYVKAVIVHFFQGAYVQATESEKNLSDKSAIYRQPWPYLQLTLVIDGAGNAGATIG